MTQKNLKREIISEVRDVLKLNMQTLEGMTNKFDNSFVAKGRYLGLSDSPEYKSVVDAMRKYHQLVSRRIKEELYKKNR